MQQKFNEFTVTGLEPPTPTLLRLI